MASFTSVLLSKIPSLDPPLLSRSMLAFNSLRYEPDRAIVKAYYMQAYSKLPMFDDYDLASMAQAMTVLRRIVKQVTRG